jgi:hypothetical protein
MFSTSNSEYGSEWLFADANNLRTADVPVASDFPGGFPIIGGSKVSTRSDKVTRLPISSESQSNNRSSSKCNRHPFRMVSQESAGTNSSNPLYRRSSADVGGSSVRSHHVPDVYFPKGNQFTSGFTDTNRRSNGFVTSVRDSDWS